MNNKKIMYLVNLLANEADDKKKELKEIYEKAAKSDSNYTDLSAVMESYLFYEGEGRLLLEEGRKLQKELMENPQKGIDTLRRMEQLSNKIVEEGEYFDTLMRRADPHLDQVAVLPKEKLRGYCDALDCIASSAAFIMMMEEGMLGVKTVYYSLDYTIQERLNAINNDFLEKLLRPRKMAECWVIKRRLNKSRYGFTDIEYYISGISYEEYCDIKKHMLMQRLNANLYVNTASFNGMDYEVPLYIGVGNLISEKPTECLPMINGGVLTGVSYPNMDFYHEPLPVLNTALRKVTGNRMYILSPRVAVDIMNQWEAGYNIYKRRLDRRCILCGDILDKGLVCVRHFNYRNSPNVTDPV